jgi:hypothetical protein
MQTPPVASESRANTWAIASLFALGIAVYGVFIPTLGFYWDDWPVIWVFNALGGRGLAVYFAGERPVSGWIYAHLFPLLGTSPIGWHAAALAVRCFSSAFLFVAFCALWPNRRAAAWMIGALALVYPGFTQQPIALSYLPHHLSFLFFSISLTATILSITRPSFRWLLVPVALVTGGASYLITEYFAGLEFLRLFVIWELVGRSRTAGWRKRLGSAIQVWSPYGAVWAAYVVWRAFVFRVVSHYGTASYKDVGSDIAGIRSRPLHEAAVRILGGIHNILMGSVFAWTRPFNPDLIKVSLRTGILVGTVGAFVVGVAIWTLRLLAKEEPPRNKANENPETGLFLGLVGLAVAGLPLAASGLIADFGGNPSFSDRFTLPFMLGAAITLSVLLITSGRSNKSRSFLAYLALFTFSIHQIQNANLYRRDWLTQKSLFWQIAWRAPVLKPGTAVFVDGLPQSLYANHTAGMLNLLYNPSDSAGHLDYFMFDLSELLAEKPSSAGAARLSYRAGDSIAGRLRSFEFRGTASPSLVSWISPGGIWRIVTPASAAEVLRGSAVCFNISPLSQPAQVISEGPQIPPGPLLRIFGPEPKHEWPYFYQRAELERQLQHWEAVAALGDEVREKGYKPDDPSEWFPFIDGYTKVHNYRTGAEITSTVLNESPDAVTALSSLWRRVGIENQQDSAQLSGALHTLENKLALQE